MHLDPNHDAYDRWRAFVERAFRLRRMYTISGSLLEMSALLVGFDNGIGRPLVLDEFQEWIAARHSGHAQLAYPALVIHEALDDHEAELSTPRSADEDEAIVDVLAALFMEFLDSHGKPPSSDIRGH
jgi:hypothetical protein